MNKDEKQIARRPEGRVENKRPPKKKKGLLSRFSKDKTEEKKDEAWNLPINSKSAVKNQQAPINRGDGQRNQQQNRPRNPQQSQSSRPRQVQQPIEGQKRDLQRSSGEKSRRNDLQLANSANQQRANGHSVNSQRIAQERRSEQRNKDSKNDPEFKNIRVYKQEDLIDKVVTKSNDRRKNFYFGVVGFIILLYFGSNIARMVADSTVETMQITKITIDTPKVYDSLIVRSESVVNATKAGEVDYKIANNEKARVGDLVSTIIDTGVESDESQVTNEQYTEVSKIANPDVENINNRIKNEFSYSKINDFTQSYIYAEKIYESLEIRNQIIASTLNESESGANNNSLAKESLYTMESGIVNYNIDSYETVYTPEVIDIIEIADIKNVTKTETAVRNKVVEAGESVFKIIKSNTWYVVAYVDTKEINSRGIAQDKNMEIYLSKTNSFLPVLAKVYSITEGDKTSKIVFECDSYIGDFAEQRVVAIKLAKENVEGYKVPKTALLQKDAIAINKDFVFFNEEEGYDFVRKRGYDGEEYEVRVEKYSTKENIVYVLKETTDLNMGDMIIDGEKVYQIPEVYRINGIYVLNTGIAVFKEVFPSKDTFEDTSLVFLEAKGNPNIRISDTIAVNIEDVNENEIIY